MPKSNSKSDLKKKKLMRLLKVKEDFFNLRGINFTRGADEDFNNNEETDDAFYTMDCSNADFTDLEEKEKKKGVKKVDRFEIVVRRDGSGDSIPGPNNFFPDIPFAMYILGVVKAGKSTLMDNILDLYAGAFDEIVMVSPTAILDDTAVEIQERYEITRVFRSLKALDPLMRQLEKINRGKKNMKDKFKTLVIMDDCINEICDLARTKNSRLNQMCVNRRHLGVSFIMLSQKFNRCPPIFRNNFNCFAIYRMENQNEKRAIKEELSGFLGNKRFEEVFDMATSEPRSFLSINLDTSDKKYQYTRNFNEIIITDDFMNKDDEDYDLMSFAELKKIARVLMIDVNTKSKKKLIKMIKEKLNKVDDDFMDTTDDSDKNVVIPDDGEIMDDLIDFDENEDIDFL